MIAAIPRKTGSSWCEILVGTAHHAPPAVSHQNRIKEVSDEKTAILHDDMHTGVAAFGL